MVVRKGMGWRSTSAPSLLFAGLVAAAVVYHARNRLIRSGLQRLYGDGVDRKRGERGGAAAGTRACGRRRTATPVGGDGP